MVPAVSKEASVASSVNRLGLSGYIAHAGDRGAAPQRDHSQAHTASLALHVARMRGGLGRFSWPGDD